MNVTIDLDCSWVCWVKHRPKISLTGVSGLGSSLCDHLESQRTALTELAQAGMMGPLVIPPAFPTARPRAGTRLTGMQCYP